MVWNLQENGRSDHTSQHVQVQIISHDLRCKFTDIEIKTITDSPYLIYQIIKTELMLY